MESKDSLSIVKPEKTAIVNHDGQNYLVVKNESGLQAFPIIHQNQTEIVTRPIENHVKTQPRHDPLVFYIFSFFFFLICLLIGLNITKERLPYSVENTTCVPSGFLWLSQTCNTRKESGYK